MSAWVVCALCALVILKPQEFIAALAGSPIVYVAFAAAIVAIAIDLIRRRTRPALAPQVPFLAAFLGWALVVSAVKHPETFGDRALGLAILAAPGLAIAVGLAKDCGVLASDFIHRSESAASSSACLASTTTPERARLSASSLASRKACARRTRSVWLISSASVAWRSSLPEGVAPRSRAWRSVAGPRTRPRSVPRGVWMMTGALRRNGSGWSARKTPTAPLLP